MVNVSLIEAILREQDNPGCSTTRRIRDIYNIRSNEEPIVQHSDEDKEFQSILFKALEALPIADDDDEEDAPISYTVKLKDSDESITPTMKRRSIIKLPKEAEEEEESESDETSSDSEKPSTASSITITKPFSPLFLNNMKKFGVSSDWLAKRSNSLRQASYSRSSVKSNTSKLDAMIKSASAKPIRSNRKLSFVETPTETTTTVEIDKENTDPTTDINENVEESKDQTAEAPVPTPYNLSSDIDEDKEDDDSSPKSKDFSLRIPRVNLPDGEAKRSGSPSLSSDDEIKQETPKPKKKRKSKKDTSPKKATKRSSKKKDKDEQVVAASPPVDETKESPEKKETDEPTTTTNDTKKSSQKKDKNDQAQARIEHLKKLLRISGIRFIMKKTELDEFTSHKAKINHLKSLFEKAGFTGSLSIKDCEKFRKKRDTEKELLEIQSSAVDVKGHVKGGRTLRGQGRTTDESDFNGKRKRVISSELEENEDSCNDENEHEKPIVKKRRILQMEASPEVSDNE